jgi:hypothetical protein
MKNLKVVTTCVNYSDYLTHTLRHNKNLFNDFTVITSTKDSDTKKLCNKHKTDIIELDYLGEDGKPFDWRGAYNTFLSIPSNKNQWVLITDSDVLLPGLLKKSLFDLLTKEAVDSDTVYCTSRVYLPMDYENIFSYIQMAQNSTTFHTLGWPILPASCWGYFMLFYNNGDKIWHHNDVIFGESFKNRITLPINLSVAHIPHGTWEDWAKNFYGRKTPKLDILHQQKIKDPSTIKLSK